MPVLRYPLVGSDQSNDGGNILRLEFFSNKRRYFHFRLTGFKRVDHIADRRSGVSAERFISNDLIGCQFKSERCDHVFDRSHTRLDGNVRGDLAIAQISCFCDQKVGRRLFVLPGKFYRFKVIGRDLFQKQARHFNIVRQQVPCALSRNKYRCGSIFTTEIDAIGRAAGYPGKIVLRVEQNATQILFIEKVNDPLSFRFDLTVHWFTPLARNPPSTTSISPVIKLAASDARKTAAPANSSTLPKRPIGVRIRNSWPRGVSSSSFSFNAVRKTPGAIAFTLTPCFAHSIARDFVSDPTAALLAEYAATS